MSRAEGPDGLFHLADVMREVSLSQDPQFAAGLTSSATRIAMLAHLRAGAIGNVVLPFETDNVRGARRLR
jgi:hypothetical protein